MAVSTLSGIKTHLKPKTANRPIHEALMGIGKFTRNLGRKPKYRKKNYYFLLTFIYIVVILYIETMRKEKLFHRVL